jgi:hypothetical protein
MEREKAEYQ